ncbi:hypothetical protein NLI96_g12333 [Meripilus lineatus]|uniref:RING-type domain-containing protein n=1 Tax=Meripilus lineatus TaxID=2056292 RepID=A0AAD5YCH9_9APHY|nr:hypothetical protein NLI96_g12333 [Physisporinus lineatus]
MKCYTTEKCAHIFCKECAMQLMKADVPCPFYCTGAHFGGLSPLLLVVFGFVKKLDYEVAAGSSTEGAAGCDSCPEPQRPL